jgi:hypothetical protein
MTDAEERAAYQTSIEHRAFSGGGSGGYTSSGSQGIGGAGAQGIVVITYTP